MENGTRAGAAEGKGVGSEVGGKRLKPNMDLRGAAGGVAVVEVVDEEAAAAVEVTAVEAAAAAAAVEGARGPLLVDADAVEDPD